MHESKSRGHQILGLLGWLALCYAAAGVGSWATFASLTDWYPTLIKPAFNPPNQIFGPVWSVLYFCMGLAAWLVWRTGKSRLWRGPLLLFLAQLGLNVLWSVLFFGLHRPDLAAAEIFVLLLTIAATAWSFWRFSRAAALLLAPYLLWVGFAAALNVAIWQLNR